MMHLVEEAKSRPKQYRLASSESETEGIAVNSQVFDQLCLLSCGGIR